MSASTNIPPLDEAIQPLINLLNRNYPTSSKGEYLSPILRVGSLETNPDELAIELPDDLPNNVNAMRAIATLLQTAGSQAKWVNFDGPAFIAAEGPLRFRLEKQRAWAGHYWAGGTYLVIDWTTGELDLKAAANQLDCLVVLLEDPANLIELGPEERALF